MEMVNRELTRLSRRRKAKDEDVHEFYSLVKEGKEVLLSDVMLSDNAEVLDTITSRVHDGLTVGELRKLIFEVCNVLEESPIRLYLKKLELESGKALTQDKREALESMNWQMESETENERRKIIERLVKLQDRIEK